MNQNHDRFTAFYQENKNKLFNYLMYRLNFDKGLAEDLLMDIVLKAYENFDKFNPEKGSFRSWFFTIAHNHLVNYWRSHKKVKTDSLEHLKEQGYSPSVDAVVDQTDKQIKKQQIQRILLLVTESERELILLKYIQDFTDKEIAQILCKNEGAVRTSLSRAMEHFRTLYQKIYPHSI